MGTPHSIASCRQLPVLQKKRCMSRGRGEFTSQIMALTLTADQLKPWRMRSDYNHSPNAKLEVLRGHTEGNEIYLALFGLSGWKRKQDDSVPMWFWMQAEECLPKVRLKNNSLNNMWPCFKVLILKYMSFWRWKKRYWFNVNYMSISFAFFPLVGNRDRVTEGGKGRGLFRKCNIYLSLKFEILDISKQACAFNSGFYCCFNTACLIASWLWLCSWPILFVLFRCISPTGRGKRKIFL